MKSSVVKLYLAGIVICLLILGFGKNCHSTTLASQPGSFLRIGLGADRVAMGDCGVALTNSSMNWFYNPASLPYLESKQAALSYRRMSMDRSVMYAGFSLGLTPKHQRQGIRYQDSPKTELIRAGLAFGIIRAGDGNIEGRDSNGEQYETFSWADNLIHSSFAIRPHQRLAFGITIKWMINTLPKVLEDDKTLYTYGLGLDLGARFQALENLQLGLQIRDLGSKQRWDASEVWGDETGEKEALLPTQVRLGAAWNPVQNLSLVCDLVTIPKLLGDDDQAFQAHGGAEWIQPFSNYQELALRIGFNGQKPTFGFGFELDIPRLRIGLDYAFVIEPNAPDPAHLFTWNFGF